MSRRSYWLLNKIFKNFWIWPASSLAIVSGAILLYSMIDASKFGNINTTEQVRLWWAFSPTMPFRNYLIPLFFSYLSHMSFSHWLSNLPFFILAAYLLQRTWSSGRIHLFILSNQILCNILLVGAAMLNPIKETHLFLGLSGVSLSMIGALARGPSYKYRFAVAVIAAYYLVEFIRLPEERWSSMNHILHLTIGILISSAFNRERSKQR